jgi:hypothetical protein
MISNEMNERKRKTKGSAKSVSKFSQTAAVHNNREMKQKNPWGNAM